MECKFSPVSLIDYWEIEFYNKNNQTCIAFLFIAKCNFTYMCIHAIQVCMSEIEQTGGRRVVSTCK